MTDDKKLDDSDPIVRLMRENTKQRDSIDEVKRILRLEFAKETDGLPISSAVRLVIKEHDLRFNQVMELRSDVQLIKKLLIGDQHNEALELCCKIMKKKI